MPDYRSREERRKAQEKNKGQKGKKGKKRGLLKKIILAACIFIGLCIVGGGIAVFAIAKNAPKLNPALLNTPMSSTIYDMNGKKVTTVFNKHNRVKVNIKNVPKLMKEAVVSIEDRRFYHHIGIDPRRIVGAAIADIAHGRLAQGASTIDQQVVKRVFLSPKKSFVRKIQGAWLAIQLDRRYSKDQILQMYLNEIYYGQGAYGIGRASEVYFGTKDLSKLNLSQMALLAGLPNLPTADDPIAHPKNAEKRRNEVLDAMVKTGYISKAQAKKAKAKSIKSLVANHKTSNNSKNGDTPYYGAFVDVLYNKLVNQRHVITHDQFFQGGLKIYTTLNQKAQKEVYHLQHSNELGYPNKYFNSGIALTDTQTGAIRAIGGGRNYTTWNSGLNFATVKTDIGSTAKPIADYGPAIEYLKWSTYHPLEDTPYKWPSGQPLHDWNNQYMGKMTARNALAYSRNIPAARTFFAVGPNKAAQFAAGLGIHVKKPVPGAFSIGSFKPGASPLQMAAAYAAFGDKGVYHKAYAVTKVVFPNGKTINLNNNKSTVAMHDYTAYMITDMLKSVINYGTGKRMNFPSGLPIAGKTGSVGLNQTLLNKYNITYPRPLSDEWFVGYTPKFSMAVWTGYSTKVHNGQAYYVKGGESPEYIAQNTFQTVITDLASSNTPDWKMPSSVVQVPVEKDTGKLASQNTPSSDIVKALYVKGTQPTEVSTKYKKPDAPQNLKASYDDKKKAINVTWNYSKGNGTKFQVAYSINGQSMQTLGTTSKNQATVQNPTPGSTYKFVVTAIQGSNKSDPAQASVKIPGIQLQPPAGAQAKYDPNNNMIVLTWSAPANQTTAYQITYSVDGGSTQTLGTTNQTQAVINNAQPGSSYTFQIVAIQGNQRSSPASATVSVPKTQSPPGQNPPPTNGKPGKGNGPPGKGGAGNGGPGNSGTDNSGSGGGSGQDGSAGTGSGSGSGGTSTTTDSGGSTSNGQ